MEKIRNIRNLAVKSILAALGLILISSQLYPFVLRGFLLTERVEIWDSTDWILLTIGFFLAVGAAKYNTVIDVITDKFKTK